MLVLSDKIISVQRQQNLLETFDAAGMHAVVGISSG